MTKPTSMPLATPRSALFTLLCGAAFAATLVGCQKTETPPPAPVVISVPGPTGATGATGSTGATGDAGATGRTGGDTIIVVPPAASAPR